MVQWLRLCTSTAGGMGLIPDQGTKILHATMSSQTKIKNKQIWFLKLLQRYYTSKPKHKTPWCLKMRIMEFLNPSSLFSEMEVTWFHLFHLHMWKNVERKFKVLYIYEMLCIVISVGDIMMSKNTPINCFQGLMDLSLT